MMMQRLEPSMEHTYIQRDLTNFKPLISSILLWFDLWKSTNKNTNFHSIGLTFSDAFCSYSMSCSWSRFTIIISKLHQVFNSNKHMLCSSQPMPVCRTTLISEWLWINDDSSYWVSIMDLDDYASTRTESIYYLKETYMNQMENYKSRHRQMHNDYVL